MHLERYFASKTQKFWKGGIMWLKVRWPYAEEGNRTKWIIYNSIK